VYEVVLDGKSLGLTSQVPIGGGTLSTGTFTAYVGTGTHTVGIEDITLSYIGFSSPFGGGIVPGIYTPAGLSVTITSAPEPASMAFSALPCSALAWRPGGASAKRRDRKGARMGDGAIS
jgi:hypothetical protein